MTRRKFLSACGAAISVATITRFSPAELPKKHGFVQAGTPQGNNVKRCFLDGEDVTNRANCASDVEGWALLYKQRPNGSFVTSKGFGVLEKRFGAVVFVMNED